MKKSVRVFAAAAAALGIGIGMPGNAAKSPIQDLAGRWSGSGTVEWKNGKQDAYQWLQLSEYTFDSYQIRRLRR